MGPNINDHVKPEAAVMVPPLSSFLSARFLRFLAVGVVNAINGTIFAYLYSLAMDANLAFVLGYVTAVTISYVLNSRFVFPSRLSVQRYVRFLLSYIPNFLIQNLCVLVVYNLLQHDKLVAYVLAAIIGVPVTFLCLKFFAFREEKQRPAVDAMRE